MYFKEMQKSAMKRYFNIFTVVNGFKKINLSNL